MTTKLTRVLVALDEGPASDAAVEHGIALAQDDDAEVVFVHVIAIAGDQFIQPGDVLERVPDLARTDALQAAVAKAEEAGVHATAELLVGYPPKQIAALAEELRPDLVVVGSRHRGSLKRFLLGSTSRALLTETTRPLLIVPEPAREPALA